jgi:hypothetical protein
MGNDMHRIHLRSATLLALAFTAAGPAAASCGSAFCLVNTNWSVQGVWNEPGWRLDLRYEYIDQDQPRAGTRRVNVGEVPAHHDEVRTKNQNLLATFDYGITPEWGVSVIVPWVNRVHDHIHNHHGEQIPEHWSFSDLGDVRVQGRWQAILDATSTERASFAGATFGVKLPTGKTDVANGEGEVAERSLQPGTGTTDLLLGAYYRQALPATQSSWFVQWQGQFALAQHAGFRPGSQMGLDAGYRYDATDKLGLMLQANFHYKARDSGSEAEPEDSGGRFLTLSPGVSYALSPQMQVYGYVQLPLWQRVNGVQLTSDWSATGGVSVQF